MLKLQIETDGDAFCIMERHELVRILREASDCFENGHDHFTLSDANRNTVGFLRSE